MKTLLLFAGIWIVTLSAALAQQGGCDRYLSVDYFRGPVYDHRNLSGALQLGTTQGVGFTYLRRVDGGEPCNADNKIIKLFYCWFSFS